MAEGARHIPRKSDPFRAYCGAPIRKSTQDRPQACPQCKRVQKREGN